MQDVIAAEPIHKRLSKEAGKSLPFTRLDKLAKRALAEGKINAEEAAILTKAEHSRLRSINVDEFEADALATKPVAKQPAKQRQTEAA